MVLADGLEPPTPASSGRRSTQKLSYTSIRWRGVFTLRWVCLAVSGVPPEPGGFIHPRTPPNQSGGPRECCPPDIGVTSRHFTVKL